MLSESITEMFKKSQHLHWCIFHRPKNFSKTIEKWRHHLLSFPFENFSYIASLKDEKLKDTLRTQPSK